VRDPIIDANDVEEDATSVFNNEPMEQPSRRFRLNLKAIARGGGSSGFSGSSGHPFLKKHSVDYHKLCSC
jgi:hypothetical protein